jgi:hypothetical protein
MMNPDPLDRKLEAYARQSLPAVPPDLDAGVWGAIEQRRNATLAARLGWTELVARPLWAAAALVFAIAIGAAPAIAFMKARSDKALVRHSLHLEAFSSHTPGHVASVLVPPRSAGNHH